MSSGPGQQQQSLPHPGPPFGAKNIWADISQQRPPRTAASPGGLGCGDSCDRSGGHSGVAGLGLVQGHRGCGLAHALAVGWQCPRVGCAPTWSLGAVSVTYPALPCGAAGSGS